jgi:DNA-binding response OmpR family regulator
MKKILIVEDELAYLKLLKSQLVEKGYTVVEAVDGKKGLELTKKEKPDLILLDIRLPVMDGMTMLGLLRKDKEIKGTKVVLLTNLEPDEKIIGEVMRDEPSYYFVKSDIQLSELFAKIKSLIGQ